MADRELSAWRMDHELQCARAPRLDGLRHVGWLYENEAEGVHSLLGHTKKAQLDVIRGDGFATYPIYAGPRHAGAEPSSPDGVPAFHITKEPGPAGTSRYRVGPPLNAVYGDEGEARYMIDSYKAVMKTLADRQKRRVMTNGVVAVDSQTKPPADADGGKLE